VNWADLKATQGAFGNDFYDRSTRTIVGSMLWTEYRPVIKIGPKGALGSHEIRPIHSDPSLGQSIGIVHSHLGTEPPISSKTTSFWKQLYFKLTRIRIKICRQTGPYGRVPQNRFGFVPNCGWSINQQELLKVIAGPAEISSTNSLSVARKINHKGGKLTCIQPIFMHTKGYMGTRKT